MASKALLFNNSLDIRMPYSSPPFYSSRARADWIKLDTLTKLRWIAIIGQSAAIVVARYLIDLNINIGICAIAIGASIAFTLISSFALSTTRRLSQRYALASIVFDMLQLTALLAMTGGLHNPFALLFLAPVTISASALTFRATVLTSTLAILLITLLTKLHLPLTLQTGEILALPRLFLSGFWVALVIGILFLALYARRVTSEIFSMSQALSATQMALEREDRLTMIGGIVAAAAHELGTPLATIKLVAKELESELEGHAELATDAALIHQQANRCREILREMGTRGKDDEHMKTTPLTGLVHEAADPHQARGPELVFMINGRPESQYTGLAPQIYRRPEIIHGLRNLIQNAVDFAAHKVWVHMRWREAVIIVTIGDDGPGYPHDLLGRIGEPFIRRLRRSKPETASGRKGYEGMGLGLFIAKTLLERTGAKVIFTNGQGGQSAGPRPEGTYLPDATGAIVTVQWARRDIELPLEDARRALGENKPIPYNP